MSTDTRLDQLRHWFHQILPDCISQLGWQEPLHWDLIPASSDASFRRYFRWQGLKHSLILMDAPPEREKVVPFVQIAEILAHSGVRVPEILASDIQNGFLLLTDLGHQTYLDVIDETNASDLMSAAIATLVQMQKIERPKGLPEYDQVLLSSELDLFVDWYVQFVQVRQLSSSQIKIWDELTERLIESALNQPYVFVHRDYMPRNLMVGVPPGVLDFQDAVWGPVTYDITSLMKDAFISWSQDKVTKWMRAYWILAKDKGIPVHEKFEDFHYASDLMGIQRHLKVLGIFARINHRDGKPKYLLDAPRFEQYIRAVVTRRPELSALLNLFVTPVEGRGYR